MSRARLNIFLEREHAKRLEELSVMKGVSKSGIIAAALASFLSPDGGDRREAAMARGWTGCASSTSDWSATRPC